MWLKKSKTLKMNGKMKTFNRERKDMRIKKIDIQDFRNHAHSVLDTDAGFVVIRGANHSGKSSIGQAISMGLTPSTSSLDPQGRGFARKIKRGGATRAIVALDIQAKHLIRQTVKLDTNTSGRTSRAVCLDDNDWKPLPFENFLARFKDALLVATNTDYFVNRMDENRQKSLMAKLALPERYDFPKEQVAAVEKSIGEGAVDFNGEPFAVIDKAYKKLYEERQVVNRQVKDFVIPDALPTVVGVDSKAIQEQLDAARAEKQKLSTDRDLAVSNASEVEVKRGKLQTKIENLRAKVEEGRATLATLGTAILSPERLKELEGTQDKVKQLAQLKSDHAGLLGTIRTANAQIERLREVSDKGPNCPTCDQEINGEKIAALIAALEKEHVEADRRIQEVDKRIEALGDVGADVELLTKHDAAVKEKAEIETSLKETVKQGKATRDDLLALGEKVDATASYVKPLEEVEARITTLLEKIRPVIAAEERAKEIKVKTEALKGLQQKSATMDALVDYFGKDGLKAKLLAEHVGGFENRINETLSAFGYKCALSIEPYEFLVTNQEGDTSLITELADSEQLMFSVAFQAAVSRAAGIGFIVADRMDTFLPTERVKANRVLYQATQDGTLDQVVMILSDESTDIPKLPNSAFFYVKEGTVSRLQPAQ